MKATITSGAIQLVPENSTDLAVLREVVNRTFTAQDHLVQLGKRYGPKTLDVALILMEVK